MPQLRMDLYLPTRVQLEIPTIDVLIYVAFEMSCKVSDRLGVICT